MLPFARRFWTAIALGSIGAALLASPLSAQQPDLSELIKRLDRLEQKNVQLEAQNNELKKQLDELKAPAPVALPPAVASPLQADADNPSVLRTVELGAPPAPAEKLKTPAKAPPESPSYQVGKSLKMEATWRNGLWFESADKAFKWTVGGVAQYDMTYFKAPSAAYINSIGTFNNLVDTGYSLQDSNSFRRARLRFAGNLWEQVEFWAQYEFAQALDLRRRTLGVSPASTSTPNNDYDPGDDVGFNEVYVGLNKLPLIGTIRIGRHRESLNFITSTSDNNQVWLERGLMFDAFNGDFNFSNGITVQNTYLNDRVYAFLGMFHSNNNSNRGFFTVGGGEYAYTGRLTATPLYDEDNQKWVHVGVDYSYRVPHQDQLRYRARPMIRSGTSFQTPNIINTGTIFTNDAQQIANLEFAMGIGRLSFAAEAARSWVTNAYTGARAGSPGAVSRGTYVAQGGYVEALYFLTPDHRKYVKDRPGYARVVPSNTFYFMDTDKGLLFNRGAWEIGARYDYLNLSNSGIDGGESSAYTACINWYLNSNTRVQANYSWMDRNFTVPGTVGTNGRVEGGFHSFGLRFNLDF